jgi:hypothetical protein
MIDVLASTCPVCGVGRPDPCTTDGRVHHARIRAALLIAAAVAALHREQDRIATVMSRRRRIEGILADDPHGLTAAITNWQVLNEPPSRLRTSPFPHVTSARGVV